MAFDLSEYVEVAERIREFREKYPDGTLQPWHSPKIMEVGEQTFVLYAAAAYRTADDPRPGVGFAWEPVPGKTPYTKDSELMNAETSAWGRAIIAVGAADAKKVASADEVRSRQEGGVVGSGDQAPSAPPSSGDPNDPWLDLLHNPGGWFDNREDKKNAKAPDFKAKKDNPAWGKAGEPWQGKPQPLALWLRDAPPHWVEAYDAGDPSLMTEPAVSARGGTVADAVAKLGGQVVDEEPPDDPDLEPFS